MRASSLCRLFAGSRPGELDAGQGSARARRSARTCTATLLTMPAVLLIVYALAVARLTKLVNSDRVTKAPREALIRRLSEESIWAYFLVCPACVSMWIALLVVPLLWIFGPDTPWLFWPAAGFAFSQVTLLCRAVDDE